MAASGANPTKEIYEFGPFTVDPQRELLLRKGEPVALTPKAFQILLVLLRRAQEIVTKDELMQAVWPDTFVEEANLSRNIFLLRKALGETPQDHRYIVTIPGRGYRFTESALRLPDPDISLVAASRSNVEIELVERKRWPWVALALVAIAAIGVGVWRLSLHRGPVLTERDTVLLGDFANSTGDSVFDETLRQGLRVQLSQSPFLSLISDDRIQQNLRMMGRPADTKLTPDVAREICQRTGSAAVLGGSIVTLGGGYVVSLNARNCRSGDDLADEQMQVGRKEDVLNALGRLATDLRQRLGESLPTVERYSRPLEQATTPSLEALKAYSSGVRVSFTSGEVAGIPLLERAVSIDPKFALAHAHLGLWYSGLDESELGAASTSRAYALRDNVTEPERYFITAMYQRDVTGNLEASRQTLELWAQAYPRDVYMHSLLSGFTSQGTGRYELSIEEAKSSIALDPDFTPAYVNWAFSDLYLDRLDDIATVLQKASERKVQTPELVMLSYFAALLKNDPTGVQRAIDASKDTPGADDWMAFSQSLVMARCGWIRAASEMSRRAIEMALQSKHRARAATFMAGQAVWQGFFGDRAGAVRTARAALQLSKARDVEFAAAFAFGLAGETGQLRALAQDLEKRFPEDTSVQSNYLPALQALLALHDSHPEKAIDLLQKCVPHEFDVTALDFNDFFGGLYPIYVRGEALAMMHRDREAAAEFEKILAHRGLLAADPLAAVVTLHMARAYARAGDAQKAKPAYESFLASWKDADPGIPMSTEARREYETLQARVPSSSSR